MSDDKLQGEVLGQLVREVWVEWAKEQENPKDSWFTPWEALPEPMKEVDRRIGLKIARAAIAFAAKDHKATAAHAFHEIEQEIGKALGYPELYPAASKVDDGTVCVGDHVPITLVRELISKAEWWRDRVVWGFYEDGDPKYIQGREGAHDICSPITAEEANVFVEEVGRLRALFPRIREQACQDPHQFVLNCIILLCDGAITSKEEKTIADELPNRPMDDVEKLEHYRDTTVGLWATDRPDLVTDTDKVLFQLEYEKE